MVVRLQEGAASQSGSRPADCASSSYYYRAHTVDQASQSVEQPQPGKKRGYESVTASKTSFHAAHFL